LWVQTPAHASNFSTLGCKKINNSHPQSGVLVIYSHRGFLWRDSDEGVDHALTSPESLITRSLLISCQRHLNQNFDIRFVGSVPGHAGILSFFHKLYSLFWYIIIKEIITLYHKLIFLISRRVKIFLQFYSNLIIIQFISKPFEIHLVHVCFCPIIDCQWFNWRGQKIS